MNYRHIYHAGSSSDVTKHILLVLILEAMLNKEKPFYYLDTHAGLGKYDLTSIPAVKTKEFEGGIGKLVKYKGTKPPIIKKYLDIIEEFNPPNRLQVYPGSPYIAAALIRPQDRIILTELHSLDVEILKDQFRGQKQVAVHWLDGYQGLKAFLPFPFPRGVILIDPPYEAVNEFKIIIKHLLIALKRFSHGCYLIWYPVKNRYQINLFEQQLKKNGIRNVLMTELNLYPDDAPLAINGSGMAIINPPWQLKEKISEIFPWLLKVLGTHQGRANYRIESSK